MPGLISSINPKIRVGDAIHLFDIAWIFGVSIPEICDLLEANGVLAQFTVASVVYYVTSTLFPAHETYLEEAIIPDDAELDAAYQGKFTDDVERTPSVSEKGSLHADIKSAQSSS